MKVRKLKYLLFCAVFIGFFTSRAEETDSVAVMLDEVSVTAVKSLSSFNDEAEALSILKQKELEQLGIVTLRGISDVVPNFYIPDYGSRITSTIYVRGIGARMDQPSVGLNVDNVPYLNKDTYDFDVADISNVEIFRGPQSTLYGRNTIAGVINITTLSPMRFQGWRLMAEAGNGGRIKATASWYHKFKPNFGLSVSGDYSHLSGFFRNLYNGELTDKENNFGARMKMAWNPSRRVSVVNTASAGWLRQGGYPYEYVETGEINYNDTCFYRRFTFADGLSVNYRGDKFSLTSITSVQHINDNMTLDQDFLPLDYFTLTQKKNETSLTEEVVLKGIKDRYKWIAGAFAFYKGLSMDAPVTFFDTGIAELIEKHRNDANPQFPIKWDSRSFVLNSKFKVPTWGVAVYHESEYRYENWLFTGALRLDYEKSTLDYHSFCNTGYEVYHVTPEGTVPYFRMPIEIDDTGNIKKDFINLLPKVTVLYEFNSLKNIYLNIARGYKSGGFNTQMFSDVLQQRLMGIMGIGSQYSVADIVSYKPEQSWNFELGSRLSFLNGKLNLELAAFYIYCHDQQLTMFPDGTTTGRIMTNAGKTRSFGAEISAGWTINRNFELNGSYGYTNAKFLKFNNGIQDFAGKYLPYVPSNTLFLQALYTLPVNFKKSTLIFDVNTRGTGPIYWNEENSRKQKFYALVGASVSYSVKDWEFKVWGRNLTDTRYYTFYFMSMGNEFLQRGRSIEAGLTIRWTITT